MPGPAITIVTGRGIAITDKAGAGAPFTVVSSGGIAAQLVTSGGIPVDLGSYVPGGGDVTAPTLSSPTGAQTGSTTATVGVTTNEANGTLYRYVSTSSTPPSAANLKSGSGAVVAGSQAISSTGAKTASIAGLTASTTYYAHFLHRDASGNDSAIVSTAGFTTAAAADVTAPTITSGNPSGSYAEGVVVNGTLTANETVTWSKSGTDAGLVTLNASTGVWSLAATDYETKTSYSWTFTATDGSANSTNQVVAITITDVAEVTSLTAPDVTVTSAAGAVPEVDIGLKSDHYAGMYLDIQRANNTSSDFTVLTLDASYQIQPADLLDGITAAELSAEGYTSPTGAYSQRYRIRAEDGPVSTWVVITGTVTASTATFATSDGANRNAGVTTTNGGLSLIAESTNSGNQCARVSPAAAADEFYFEVKVDQFDSDTTGGIRAGIVNSSQSFAGTTSNIGGNTVTTGFTCRLEPDSANMGLWYNGALQTSQALGANPTANAVIGIRCKKSTREVWIYYDADGVGMSSTHIRTFTLNIANVPDAWHAYGCVERGEATLTDCDKLTANFGGSAFAIGTTLPGSAVAYG